MTLVGRSKIDHPALGTAGGSALHASIETIYTNVGNHLSGRYLTATGIANSAVTTFDHNFGVPFADLQVLIYTGTYPALTRVADPAGSGWTIAATSGFLQEKVDVTAPSSGGPHSFSVIISEKVSASATQGGIVNTTTQTFAGVKTWNDIQTFKAAAGTVTALAYDSAGAVTVGASGSAQSFTANALNFKLIRADGTQLRLTASASYSFYDSFGLDNSTNGGFQFRSLRADSSNVLTVATINDLGASTFGSAATSLGAITHTFQNGTNVATDGTITFLVTTGNQGAHAAAFKLTNSLHAAADTFQITVGSGITSFRNGTPTTLASVDNSTGAWTLGVTASQALVSTRPIHNLYSRTINLRNPITSVAGGGSAVTDLVFLDFYNRADAAKWSFGLNESQFGGTETNPALMWYSYNATNYVGGISSSGAWTLGPSVASSTVGHIVRGKQGLLSAWDGVFNLIANNSATGDTALGIGLDKVGGNVWISPASYNSGVGPGLRFGSFTTDVGGYTSAGAWTLGATATTSSHNMRINANVDAVLRLRNTNSTAKSSYLQIEDSAGAVQDLMLENNTAAGTGAGNYGLVGIAGAGLHRFGGPSAGSSNNAHTFRFDATELMAITRAGSVTLGGSSLGVTTHYATSGDQTEFRINSGGSNKNAYLSFAPSGTGSSRVLATAGDFVVSNGSDTAILTGTQAGAWTLGASSGTGKHTIQSTTTDYNALFKNSHASDPYGLNINFSATAPNNTSNTFIQCNDNSTNRFTARSNGGLANYQANDVNLSDERTKTDIKPSKSYLGVICAIPVVTFKYKDQTHDDDNLGVIAQQVEAVAPEFIDQDGWGANAEDGTPLKSIYNTDLMFAVMKAVQELKSKLDEANARIAELEAE